MAVFKSTYRFYLKLVILAVYLIFFAVQLFFSFYSGHRILRSTHLFSSTVIKKHAQLSENPKPNGHPVGFRLNKHFQPQYLPSGLFPRIKIPVEYISVRNLIPYSVDFISSQFSCSSALRGPPAMNSIS